jgi:trk system potassium uptake protein TrkA
VVVVEIDPELVARCARNPAVRWLAGDACELGVLGDAGTEQADVVVAATGDDEDNLVVSLLAKQEFAVPRVVARVNHPKNHWL